MPSHTILFTIFAPKISSIEMNRLRLIIVLYLALSLLTGCHRKAQVQPKPHWFKHYHHFKEKEYVQYIESQINVENDTLLMPTLVRDFYRYRHFHPLWTQKGLQEAMTDSLMAHLTDAYPTHGIPGEYFHLDSIQQSIKQLMEHEVPDNEALYPHLYRIERLLTDQYLRYACALEYGAVNPKRVHGNKWYYETLSPDSAFLLTTKHFSRNGHDC